MIGNREQGMLFEPGNSAELTAALRTLAERTQLRRSLAEQGGNFVRTHFSIQSSVRSLEQIYTRLFEAQESRSI